MYEELIFKAGVWIGYFITVFCFCFFSLIAYMIIDKRRRRFLREHKLVQAYEDWEIKQGFKIVKK